MSDVHIITKEDRSAYVASGGRVVPDHIIVISGEKHLKDPKGRLVPVDTIKAETLLEDETVRTILTFAQELEAQIKRFKQHTLADVTGFLSLIAQNYGVTRGGTKGNLTLTTFDGLQKVQVAVADQVAFGPQLQAAKALVDECLGEWTSDSNAALRTIVQAAFDTEKEGEVSPAKLFPLLRHDIDDPRWKRAMEAIVDAIQIRGTKEYVRFYRRARATDRWEHVSIDVASA